MCDALRKLVGAFVFLCGAFAILLFPGGCSFQPIQTNFFQFAVITPGAIAWSIVATGSGSWGATVTSPQVAIRNLTGPPVYIEAVETFLNNFDGTTPQPSTYSFPVKLQIAGIGEKVGPGAAGGAVNNLAFSLNGVEAVYGFIAASTPTDNTVVPSRHGRPDLRTQSLKGVVLWRNSLGQRNYRGGNLFDAGCFCYPPLENDDGTPQVSGGAVLRDDPQLVTNNVAPEVIEHAVDLTYTVTYTVGGT